MIFHKLWFGYNKAKIRDMQEYRKESITLIHCRGDRMKNPPQINFRIEDSHTTAEFLLVLGSGFITRMSAEMNVEKFLYARARPDTNVR